MEKEKIEELYDIYTAAYEDQLEAAEPEYLEWFTEEYEPPEEPWDTKEEAAAAMSSLLSELRDDRDDVESLMIDCGLTDELDAYFGLEVFGDGEDGWFE